MELMIVMFACVIAQQVRRKFPEYVSVKDTMDFDDKNFSIPKFY